MSKRLRFWRSTIVLLLVASAIPVRAACDLAGADATAIADARDAIDAGCPCAAAASRAGYRQCALQVVRGLVDGLHLPVGCRRETLRHAKLSICGRPGAAVCCRVRADGRTHDGVVTTSSRCASTSSITACVSTWQSVPVGCDSSGGCIPPPVCGDGIVNGADECDPPDYLFCDASCHRITCDPAPGLCGNGTIDPGEACEPPGAGDCGPTCQLASCDPPASGEIALACVAQPFPDGAPTTVAAGATPSGYLVGWNGQHQRARGEVLVERLDADGNRVDAGLTVATDGTPCAAEPGGVSIGADGSGYYTMWNAGGLLSDGFPGFQAIYGRRVGGTTGVQSLDQHDYNVPFGMCQVRIGGQTTVAGISADRFAIGYAVFYFCVGQTGFFGNPVGRIIDFNAAATVPPVGLGFEIAPPPNTYSATGADVAALGGDVLWAWHALFAQDFSNVTNFVAGVWTAATSSTSVMSLSARGAYVEKPPSVAAGDASLLVAWAQGVPNGATTATEVRAIRVTRAAGNLDPDGGVLLGTAATQVAGGPAAAFDGTRWLVVWAESSGFMTWELRAVAVAQDGTVLDASPRLVASNVNPSQLAVASVGDGRVLVVFGRAQGSQLTAVRAVLVTP